MDVYIDGVVRLRYLAESRTVISYDAAGATTPSTPEAPNPRPYTTEENAAADQAALQAAEYLAQQQLQAEHKTLKLTIKSIITDLQAEKTRAQTVIDAANATSREKDLGRACKRIAGAAIDLARFVKGM